MNIKQLFPILKNITLYGLDHKYGFSALERKISINWFNPLLTFWFNFRSFKLSQAIRFPVYVYGRPRIFSLFGTMEIIGDVKSGMISFNQTREGSPNVQSVQSEILNDGHIVFRGHGVIGTGVHICVGQNGTLDIGNNFKITDLVNIGCFKSIKIGEQSRVTHKCQVLDSNYHYVANFNKRIVPDRNKTIEIGKGCWICNSSTVTGGTKIPNFTILSSNSLANKDYSDVPEGSIIGGIPAKYIASGFRRVENAEIERPIDRYYEGTDKIFIIPDTMNEVACSNFI